MTHPKILEAERFGCKDGEWKSGFTCLGCEGHIDLDREEYVFDRFGRIFCSEGCLDEYFYKGREKF